jgi:hypothetical protein
MPPLPSEAEMQRQPARAVLAASPQSALPDPPGAPGSVSSISLEAAALPSLFHFRVGGAS